MTEEQESRLIQKLDFIAFALEMVWGNIGHENRCLAEIWQEQKNLGIIFERAGITKGE